MKITFLKHSYSSCICLLICTFFHVQNFAQNTPIPKAKHADSIIKNTPFANKQKNISFSGIDGPYIINDTLLYRVNSKNKLSVTPIFNNDSIVVRTDTKVMNEFYLPIKSNYKIPKTTYDLPEKVAVISDIEGNYNAFVSFLFSNKIIDKNHNWIYGNGHLVLGGDFVDRGKNVTQVLWLIYKLEHQAKKENGLIHFILGNHEVLNFHGDHRYNRGKYIKAAQEISQIKNQKKALKYLYSKKSTLGRWLATKNVIEKIGNYLFVHGGLSPEILDYKLSLNQINNIMRFRYSGLNDTNDDIVNFLYSPKGPFWYRGLVKSRFQYDKIKTVELKAVLKYYNAKKIVIGHTPVKTISTGFNGSVIRTDVTHGKTKFSGKTKGLLIVNGQEFIIDDTAVKTVLEN